MLWVLKKSLNETVLVGTQNTCLKWEIRKKKKHNFSLKIVHSRLCFTGIPITCSTSCHCVPTMHLSVVALLCLVAYSFADKCCFPAQYEAVQGFMRSTVRNGQLSITYVSEDRQTVR